LAIALVKVYRYSLSALLGGQCRYLPTCSEYALDALRLHGFWPGSVMAFARICRCGPFGGHGFDPVPSVLPGNARWWLFWRYGVWRTPRTDDSTD
jgi:putative membrane protein insertion efficiency factor